MFLSFVLEMIIQGFVLVPTQSHPLYSYVNRDKKAPTQNCFNSVYYRMHVLRYSRPRPLVNSIGCKIFPLPASLCVQYPDSQQVHTSVQNRSCAAGTFVCSTKTGRVMQAFLPRTLVVTESANRGVSHPLSSSKTIGADTASCI